MDKQLRILMLEDRAEDAALVKDSLRKSGLRFSFDFVDSKESFLRRLAEQKPDVVLSDHGLPAFDGLSALRIVKEKCPDVPVVFVTGALGEEFAIRIFENGASDYVLKHHLGDLAPAIQRALSAAEEARRRSDEDEQLRRHGELFRNLVDGVKDYALYMLDTRGHITTWNTGAERIDRFSAKEAIGQPLDILFTADEVARGKPRQILEIAARDGPVHSQIPVSVIAHEFVPLCIEYRCGRAAEETAVVAWTIFHLTVVSFWELENSAGKRSSKRRLA